MTTLLLFVGTILVLVGVHEFAHFLVGKITGVYVKEFAIGFGPKLVSFEGRETRYSIRAIPFGGYVRFAGEDREKLSDVIPEERLLYRKPPRVRIAISLAGPLANLFVAFLVATLIAWAFGVPHIRIVDVIADRPAAGILAPGDRILSIEGREVYTDRDVSSAIQRSRGRSLRMTVLRDGVRIPVSLVPEPAEEGGYVIGIRFGAGMTTTVTRIDPDAALFDAGLRAGDAIEEIGGRPIRTGLGLVERVEELLPAPTLTVVIRRQDQHLTISVPAADLDMRDLLSGLSLHYEVRRPGFFSGIALGGQQFAAYVRGLLASLRGLLTGRIAAGDALSGPVGIAQQLGEAFRLGPSAFLSIFAFFSLWLGLLNLIPFPALDGSRAAFALVELVRGKPIPLRWEGMIHAVGFLILLGLMVLITFKDLLDLFR